jgi:hypothetical protein
LAESPEFDEMNVTRRNFMRASTAGLAAAVINGFSTNVYAVDEPRNFHLCLPSDDIELMKVAKAAGISTIWTAAFFYGYWPAPLEKVLEIARKVESLGMEWGVANIPLGHPGDSLGDVTGKTPLTPPKRWKMGLSIDGKQFSGTSLHSPATEENVEAIKQLRQAGVKRIILDDDFRLARSPGIIGGCFCDEHRTRFLKAGGYSDEKWAELLQNIRQRHFTGGSSDGTRLQRNDSIPCQRTLGEEHGRQTGDFDNCRRSQNDVHAGRRSDAKCPLKSLIRTSIDATKCRKVSAI